MPVITFVAVDVRVAGVLRLVVPKVPLLPALVTVVAANFRESPCGRVVAEESAAVIVLELPVADPTMDE
jgi:hypothetical protein